MGAQPPQPGGLDVLVVDDEPNIRTSLAACLEVEGHRVALAKGARDALDAVRRRSFDLAFVDLQLGQDKGLDLIPALLSENPWLKVVVITAYSSIDSAVESMRRGATDYLPKPFTPAQVGLVSGKVAALRALEQKVEGLQDALGERPADVDPSFASAHPAMSRAVALARQVAESDATVLIRGESGTGKGVLAKALHQWSARSSKRFAVVSCPSLSPELLESELFGHVKGAFTNAVRDNPGRVAATEGGTLLLDEIGDLPLSVQPKLLRFVQDREYERVGDHVTRRADVRVIAATNVDLDGAVKAGLFRQDLLYRLNVIQIVIPPLRDRPDDVVALAEQFLVHFSRRNRKPTMQFDAGAVAALRAYAWPGNVRELRNVIERTTILCRGAVVTAEQLLLEPAPPAPPAAGGGAVAVGDRVPLEEIEQRHIRAVLESTATIEEAAQILRMDTTTLWRRRKKYGV